MTGEKVKRTILIFDIVDAAELMELAGVLTWKRVTKELFDRAEGFSNVLGTEILKFTGDGFIILFENPSVALKTAVDLLVALRGQPMADSSKELLLQARIALNTANVELSQTPYGKEAYGLGLSLTARMNELALPGQILLSESTFDLLTPEDKAKTQEIDGLTLKGFDRKTRIWRVDVTGEVIM